MAEGNIVTTIARQGFGRAWRFLVRTDVAAVLIIITLLLAALGSCFPYLPQAGTGRPQAVTTDAERLARWEAGIRARHGALTQVLLASGAFGWFHSPVFLVPLALLALATLACTLDRWPRVWRRAFGRERERSRLAPLGTLANHLAVPLLLAGVMLSSAYSWREALSIEPGAGAEVGHGSNLALRNEGFVIERYPNGNVAAYEAGIAVIKQGDVIARHSLGVNQSLAYGGIGFYLQGYGETDDGYSITLLAVHDPGYSLVVAAGFSLVLGLAAVLL